MNFSIFFFHVKNGNFTVHHIAPDKTGYPHNIFSYFSAKTYIVGTPKSASLITEVLLIRASNIYFHKEIRKIWIPFVDISVISGAMALILEEKKINRYDKRYKSSMEKCKHKPSIA